MISKQLTLLSKMLKIFVTIVYYGKNLYQKKKKKTKRIKERN